MFFLSSRLKSHLLAIVFICISLNNFSQQNQQIFLTGHYENTSYTEFFSQLKNDYNLRIYFDNKWLEGKYFSADFKNNSLEEALIEILKSTPYDFEIVKEKYVVLMPREKVALIKKTNSSFVSVTASEMEVIGDPADEGKFQNVKLSGTVIDGKTGEVLIGSTVWVENTNIASSTNSKGVYSINVSPGIYSLQFSNMGFEKKSVTLKVISNGNYNIELFQETTKLDEVVVYAKDAERNVKGSQMSIVELNSRELKQLPSLVGEKDILKSFTMMPGVQSVGEFGSGFNVRGGGEDQNLYLLEGSPVFNTSHLFGMLSVVNPDVVKEVTLYKGHIPSEYGERVSSVMDIKAADNGITKPGVKGGIGIFNSRLLVQTPIIKNHISFKIAGRSSYSDWLLKKMPDYNLQNSSTEFYDLTLLLNADYRRNKVQLFAYKSFDDFSFSDYFGYSYGNEMASISWQSTFAPNLTGRLLLALSNYDVSREDYGTEQDSKIISSDLEYKSGKYHLNYTGINRNNLEAGAQLIHYRVNPGEMNPSFPDSDIKHSVLQTEQGRELAFYLNDKIDFSDWLSVNAGVRFTSYNFYGIDSSYIYKIGLPKDETTDSTIYHSRSDIISSFAGLEPRLSVKILTSQSSSIKISYNRNSQYISLLSLTSIPTPNDIWKLSDHNFKPVQADQIALGFYKNLRNNTIETSLELYYKTLSNLPVYKNNAKPEMNQHIETELISSQGRNYGAEFFIKKNNGLLEGWISYTYSRSFNKTSSRFKEEIINNNEWYSSSYDKPHSFSMVATYHINKRVRFTGTFNYSSGRAVTLPEYQYWTVGSQMIFYSPRNYYRLPDYHRLDVALSIDESLRKTKKWKGSWTFSIINVYGRKNAYSVFYLKENPNAANNYKLYSLNKLYIIGIPLPTLTYNFIF